MALRSYDHLLAFSHSIWRRLDLLTLGISGRPRNNLNRVRGWGVCKWLGAGASDPDPEPDGKAKQSKYVLVPRDTERGKASEKQKREENKVRRRTYVPSSSASW